VKKRKALAVRQRGKSGDSSAAVRSLMAQEKLVWKAAQERNAEEFSKRGSR
jgi:hypothetical protein